MSGGRLTMKPIQMEKTCKATFQKRKKSLMKKAYEFSTLCGVDTCIMIYGPNFHGPHGQPAQPETWPQDPREVNRIIEKYKNKIAERSPKSYDLPEFFKDRRKKVEAEISKVHKETLKILHLSSWDNYFNALREDELRIFITKLDAKLDTCNQRINMLKRNRYLNGKAVESEKTIPPYYLASNPRGDLNFLQNMYSQGHISLTPMKPLSDNNNNQPEFYPFQIDKSSQSQLLHFDQNYMQLMANNWTGQVGATTYDSNTDLLKEYGVENDQNSSLGCYKGSVQTTQPYRHYSSALQTLPSRPQGFQTDGYLNMLQPQMPYYETGKK